jgi:hypothetical protein
MHGSKYIKLHDRETSTIRVDSTLLCWGTDFDEHSHLLIKWSGDSRLNSRPFTYDRRQDAEKDIAMLNELMDAR